MPRILKIIGKSVLSFIGLSVLTWVVEDLGDFLLTTSGSVFYGLLKLTVLQYITWLLLGTGYAYVLFIIFKSEKKRALIVMLNGSAIFIQFFVLLFLNATGDEIMFSFRLSHTFGLLTIMLAFIFNNLTFPKKIQAASIKRNWFNALLSLSAKSAACFLALIAALYGYSVLYEIVEYGIVLLYCSRLIFSAVPVLYACMLYKLIQKNKYRLLVMSINAVLLLAVWSLIYLYDFTLPLNIYYKFFLCAVCGNTAIMTIVLAFIFRSVEKHGNNRPSCTTWDSSVADTSSE